MFEKYAPYLDPAYIQAVMRCAVYEQLEDDATSFGHIPGFQGVWANAATPEETRVELQSALEDWLLVGMSKDETFPEVDGIRLNYPKVRA